MLAYVPTVSPPANRIAPYVKLGFEHLIFHGPGDDQERFLQTFSSGSS